MRIDVLTLFPGMFSGVFGESIIGRAQESGLAKIWLHNIRDWAEGKHKVVDDTPYGGGPGMVMKPEPLAHAIRAVSAMAEPPDEIILLSPQGEVFSQTTAADLARSKRLVFVCGHYEGIDERVISALITKELSIGDYVLTGGEIPAMVIVDAVIRLIPGVLGSSESVQDESFQQGLLEYPQYTRPAVWEGLAVPEVLLSGHHAQIERWRREQSILRTFLRRPDLLAQAELTTDDRKFLDQIKLSLAKGGESEWI